MYTKLRHALQQGKLYNQQITSLTEKFCTQLVILLKVAVIVLTCMNILRVNLLFGIGYFNLSGIRTHLSNHGQKSRTRLLYFFPI